MKKLIAILLAAMLLLSLAACAPAQPAGDQTTGSQTCGDKFVVGVCQLVPHEALDQATKGFVDALKEELGEENVEIIEKVGAGDMATCTPIVTDFVSKEVDLIMANATPALQAAAAATEEIPILGTSVTEYGVALEIVQQLSVFRYCNIALPAVLYGIRGDAVRLRGSVISDRR